VKLKCLNKGGVDATNVLTQDDHNNIGLVRVNGSFQLP